MPLTHVNQWSTAAPNYSINKQTVIPVYRRFMQDTLHQRSETRGLPAEDIVSDLR